MKIKDIEKRIQTSVEDKSPQVNPGVLDAVKREMGKDEPKKSPDRILKYSIIACLSVICLTLIIVLPIVFLRTPHNQYTETEFSSMEEYVLLEGIEIKPYSELLEDGVLDFGDNKNAVKAIECKIIKLDDRKDACIEETYTFDNGNMITMSILLSEDNKVENDLFSDYANLDKKTTYSNTELSYSFDFGIGKAKFGYNGYKIYFLFDLESEQEMLFYIQTFIEHQNN